MTEQHPITPPPELVQQWIDQGISRPPNTDYMMWFATQAARWGADQELEACCHLLWLQGFNVIDDLRAARRPKPPNKKQRGLTALEATSLKKDDPLLYREILNAIKELPDG